MNESVGAVAARLGVDISRDLEQEFIEASRKLASCGWTIPSLMAPREFFEISYLGDQLAIDTRFINFYRRMGTPFVGSAHFARWCPLLEQCKENYDRGDYLI
jgi:hypothetical protein